MNPLDPNTQNNSSVPTSPAPNGQGAVNGVPTPVQPGSVFHPPSATDQISAAQASPAPGVDNLGTTPAPNPINQTPVTSGVDSPNAPQSFPQPESPVAQTADPAAATADTTGAGAPLGNNSPLHPEVLAKDLWGGGTPPPEAPVEHTKTPWFKSLWFILLAALFATGIIAGAFYVFGKPSKDTTTSNSKVNENYEVTSVPLSDLASNEIITIGNDSQLAINGQLRINNSAVIEATEQPANPEAGMLWYSSANNTLYYYNGTQFVPMSTSIGGVAGTLSLGGGLSLVNSSIVNSGVISIQGQAGNVDFAAGGGISINGTTITNTGVLGITAGNPNQLSVTSNNGNVSISLAGISAGGVLVGTAGGGIGTVLPANPGLCLISNGSNLPEFGSCTGVQTVNSVNGLDGILTIAAGTGIDVQNSGGNTITIASTAATGVTQLNLLSGSLSIANATTSGSTININKATSAQLGLVQGDGTTVVINGSGVISIGQDVATTANVSFNQLSLTQDLAVSEGGTGASTFAAGGLLVGNGSSPIGVVSALAPGQCLISGAGPNFTPSFNNCPVGGNVSQGSSQTQNYLTKWDAATNSITNSIIQDNGSTATVGGNLTVNSGIITGNGSGISNVDALTLQGYSATSFESAFATLGVAKGGTGATTLTQNGILLGNGTGAITAISPDTAGLCLMANGPSSAPTFQSCPVGGNVAALSGSPSFLTKFAANGIDIENSDLLVQAGGLQVTAASYYLDIYDPSNSTFTIQNTNAGGVANLDVDGKITGSGGLSVGTGKNITSQSGGIKITSGTSANDNITFETRDSLGNLLSFIFPSTGGTGQTICTSGITCATGGGQAVILEPGTGSGTAQTTAAARPSIWINRTGGTDEILKLQANGKDALVLSYDGKVNLGTSGPTGLTGDLVFRNATNSNTVSLTTDQPSSSYTLTLPNTAGNASECLKTNGAGVLSWGTCITGGSGGGLTGSGSIGKVALFSGTQSLGDSIISQASTSISIAGDLKVTGTNTLTLGTSDVGGNDGSIVFLNSSNTNTLKLQSGATAGNLVFTLPTDDGGANECLKSDGSGVLSWGPCLSGSGGGGGVTSINTLSSAVTLAGTTDQISITPSGNTLIFSTPQDIATNSDVQFNSIATTSTINSLNLSSTAISTSTTNGNLAVNANGTGTVSIGGTSTGDILLGGGLSSTGCTLTNSSGAFACTGTLNGATISGGTLSGGNVSGGTFSGGTVSGGTLSGTAVNGLNVGANAISTSSGNLTINANGSGTVDIGGTSTGDITLGGGSASTGCTLTNNSGAFACTGTLNGATISGGTLSGGAVSGGTITGGTLSGTAVNGLNVGANAISTTSGDLTVDSNGAGQVKIGGISTGDILLGGGFGATGCTVTNTSGDLTCNGRIALGNAVNTSGAKLQVAGGAQLQTTSAGATNTNMIGTIFYDTGDGKFKIYEGALGTLKTLCNVADGCSVASGFTLNSAYQNYASSPASILLNGARGGILLQDDTTPLGTNLFAVQNNGGTVDYFGVKASGSTFDYNSATALVVQNGATDTFFTVNASSQNRVKIGNSTGSVAADTTLFIVDSATTAATPAGVNGGIYYDSTTNQFKFYEAGAYRSLSSTLQQAYAQGNSITTTDNRDINFTLAETSTDASFVTNLQCSTCSSLGGRFAVQYSGTDVFTIQPTDGSTGRGVAVFKNQTNSANAFQIQASNSNTLFNANTSTQTIAVTNALTSGNALTVSTSNSSNTSAALSVTSASTTSGNSISASGTQTTGTILSVSGDSLTTGKVLSVTSASTGLTSGTLISVVQNPTYTGTTSQAPTGSEVDISRNTTVNASSRPAVQYVTNSAGVGSTTMTVSGNNTLMISSAFNASYTGCAFGFGLNAPVWTVGAVSQTLTATVGNMYYLVNPTPGAGTLSQACAFGGTNNSYVQGTVFSNVDQNNPINTTTTTSTFTGTGPYTISNNITPFSTSDMVYDEIYSTSGWQQLTRNGGQTTLQDIPDFTYNRIFQSSYKAASTSPTSTSWTSSTNTGGHTLYQLDIKAAPVSYTYSNPQVKISSNCTANANSQCFDSGNTLRLEQNLATATGSVLQIQNTGTGPSIQGGDGSGSNAAGNALTVAGGRSTGNAAGGNLNFQISPAGSSGSTLNPLSTVFSLSGTNGAALFKNAANSTTAFRIQNSGSDTLFNVDTSTSAIGIGNPSGAAASVTIGSTTGTSAVLIQGGSSGVTVKPADSTGAFKVQNQAGASIVNVDTTNGNLFTNNPSFESNDGFNNIAMYGSKVQSSAQAFHGSYSALITISSGAGSNAYNRIYMPSLTAGQTYTLSFYVRGQISSVFWNNITTPDNAACTSGNTVSVSATSSAWTRASCTWTATNTSGYYTMQSSPQTYYLDAIRLETGTSMSPYLGNAKVNIGSTSAATGANLSLYNPSSSVTQTDMTQSLTTAGLNMITDYTASSYTPGLFWSTQNDNPTKPKAGMYLLQTASGTSMLFGTSNNYASGITNTALTLDPSANVISGADLVTTSGTVRTISQSGNTTQLSLQSGNSTAGTAGNVSLDVGTSFTGSGSILIGSTNTRAITIGNTSATTTSVQGGTAVNIGTANVNNTIQIGNTGNAVTQSINIGNNTTAGSQNNVTLGSLVGASSTTTIQGGTGSSAVSIQSGAAGTINIGTSNVNNTVQIGSTANAVTQTIKVGYNSTGSSDTTLQMGSNIGVSSVTLRSGTGGIAASSTTATGTALSLAADSLTTGTGLSVTSSSSSYLSGSQVQVTQNPTYTANNTNTTNLLNINRTINLNNPAVNISANSTNSGYQFANPGSSNYTVSGSLTVNSGNNRYLVISLSTPTSSFCNFVSGTFDGTQNLTSIDQNWNGGNGSVMLLGLSSPNTGTNRAISITMNCSGGTGGWGTYWSAMAFNNVNLSNPYVNPPQKFTTLNGNVTVTGTDSSQMVVDALVTGGQYAGSVTQSGQVGVATTSAFGHSSYRPGQTTSTDIGWSGWSSVTTNSIELVLNRATVLNTISGNVATFSSNCTGSGNCTDTSNILNLNQQYSGATGDVLKIQNAGSGDSINVMSGATSAFRITNAAGTEGSALFQNKTDNTTAFRIQGQSTAFSLAADTLNGSLSVTSTTAATAGLLSLSQSYISQGTQSLSASTQNISRSITTTGVPVAIDTANISQSSGALTWNHVIGSQTNRAVIVTVHGSGNVGSVTSVKFGGAGGTSMTRIPGAGDNQYAAIYILPPASVPVAGTYQIVIAGVSANSVNATAATYYNVDSGSPYFGAAAGFYGMSSSPISVSGTSTADMVVDAASTLFSSGNISPASSGQTALLPQYTLGSIFTRASYRQGVSSSTDMTWNTNGNWVQYGAVALRGMAGTTSLLGAVSTISGNCTQAGGVCADTSNILNLNQQYSGATGAVLRIQNSGTGADLQLSKGTIQTTATNAVSTNSVGVSIQSGNASGATSNSGDVTIDSGTATGSTGNIYIGNTNSMTVQIGNANATIGSWANNSGYNLVVSGSQPRMAHGSAVYNGYVYVVGGQSSNSVANAVDNVYYAKLNSDGSIPTTGVGIWAAAGNNLPGKRTFHSVVAANGYLYAIGGMDETSTVKNTVYYAKINSNGTVGAWQTESDTITAVQGHRSVAYNGYLYVVGGSTTSATTGAVSTVQYARINADGSTGAWATTTAIGGSSPVSRYAPGVAVGNGYLYVAGGIDSGSTVQSTVYLAKLKSDGTIDSGAYNATTNPGAWRTSNAIVSGGTQARYGLQLVASNGNLYAFGGNSGSGAQTGVYSAPLVNDGSIGTWSTLRSMTLAANYHQVVTANGYFYSIGGIDGSNAVLNTVYYSSAPRVKVAGSLDLIGSDNIGLTEGGAGGELTAGNTRIVGSFEVSEQANFMQGVSIGGNLTVGGKGTNANPVFAVQNSSGANLLTVDTQNNNITIGANNSGELQPWASSGASLGGGRSELASTILNGYVYSIGGGSSTTVEYSKINADGTLSGFTTTNTLPAARNRLTAVGYNGYLYAIGGSNGSSTDTVYYAKQNADGSTSNWSQVSTIDVGGSKTRSGHTTVVANGYLFVIGGEQGGTAQTTVYSAKINSDGTLGSWQSAGTLPAARFAASAIVVNGKLLVIGGSSTNSSANNAATVLSASIATNGTISGGWTTQTPANMPALLGHGSVFLNGNVYIIGGNNGSAVNTVYYAPVSSSGTVGTFTQAVNSLSGAKDYLGVASANGYVYALGGNGGSTVLYSSTQRVKVGGALDLVGFAGGNLADAASGGSMGGELTAGNTNIVGALTVQGQANFAGGVGVGGNLNVGGDLGVAGNLKVYSNSATALQITKADGTSVVFNVDNSASVAVITINGNIAFNGRIITSGSAPSTAVNANAGTGATCTVNGNDTAGTITLTSGSGSWATGTQCTLTFNGGAWSAAPRIVVTPSSSGTAARQVYGATTTTTFTIGFDSADSGANVHTINYVILR